MKNLREVKDDLLKEWLEFREETAFSEMTPQDKKYCIYFEEIAERILKNVPEQNKKYVQKQLEQLEKNFMDYLYYWNEKYYRNGFVDVLNYDGMIHLAYLIAKRGDYSHFDFERRKSIFWAIFYFSSRVKVKIRTVIVDKKYINKKTQLNVALAREISKFINDNLDYINSFDKIVIYYDNGQETLATILDTLFASNPNVERRIDFDHTKKRLFQVSDMLTVIDKLDYKRKNNIPFTKAETFFFRGKDFRHIINLLKNKRI